MTQRRLVNEYQRIGGTSCFHLQYMNLETKAVFSPKMFTSIHQCTWNDNAVDHNTNFHNYKYFQVSRDSAVGIATDYGLDD
jgi:hypothetical protein